MPAELPKPAELAARVFTINNAVAFEALALDIFRFQYRTNEVYQQYCSLIHRRPETVHHLHDVPFLPISFFKTHNVQCGAGSIHTVVFESSGTTGQQPSRHTVLQPALYETSFRHTFERFYGPMHHYCIVGLLPSYLERRQSSLVYMVDDLIKRSGHAESGFYLYDYQRLAQTLTALEAAGQKTLLFGVTYALLDFAEQCPMPLKHTAVIETGGMKGRKEEWLRHEVHGVLKKSFALPAVHSEYGMTELLSQAYAVAGGRFQTPDWMQVRIREEDDPLSQYTGNRAGGINIIDLANVYSCAFIATEDIGRKHADGSFEVLGQLDNAEIRGCSLLAL